MHMSFKELVKWLYSDYDNSNLLRKTNNIFEEITTKKVLNLFT